MTTQTVTDEQATAQAAAEASAALQVLVSEAAKQEQSKWDAARKKAGDALYAIALRDFGRVIAEAAGFTPAWNSNYGQSGRAYIGFQAGGAELALTYTPRTEMEAERWTSYNQYGDPEGEPEKYTQVTPRNWTLSQVRHVHGYSGFNTVANCSHEDDEALRLWLLLAIGNRLDWTRTQVFNASAAESDEIPF